MPPSQPQDKASSKRSTRHSRSSQAPYTPAPGRSLSWSGLAPSTPPALSQPQSSLSHPQLPSSSTVVLLKPKCLCSCESSAQSLPTASHILSIKSRSSPRPPLLPLSSFLHYRLTGLLSVVSEHTKHAPAPGPLPLLCPLLCLLLPGHLHDSHSIPPKSLLLGERTSRATPKPSPSIPSPGLICLHSTCHHLSLSAVFVWNYLFPTGM